MMLPEGKDEWISMPDWRARSESGVDSRARRVRMVIEILSTAGPGSFSCRRTAELKNRGDGYIH
jgi:hypothetical protein